MGKIGMDEFSKPCGPCELREQDFSAWPDNSMTNRGVMVVIKGALDAGDGIEAVPNEAYDPDSGFEVPSNRIPVVKRCAERIVSGECKKYKYKPPKSKK